MAENDTPNGRTEAATDLEKKIIKQIEVSKTIKRRSETSISCLLFQILDLQAILLLSKPVFKLNMHSTIMESPAYTCVVPIHAF